MIDNSQLRKLLSLSDEELRRKVADAAVAAGADKYMTTMALSDTARLRGMLNALSADEINAMLARLGPETARELSKRITGQ